MGLFNWLQPASRIDAELQKRIDYTAVAIDPLIRQVKAYEKRLAPAVRHALAYCEGIANRIPGPFAVNRAAFVSDPLIHALFGSADAIDHMLATSQCVREHLSQMTLETGQCCALLGMRIHEKKGFGAELDGEIVRSDVVQTTLYFSDHTLAEPSRDEASARLRLRDMFFDSIVKGVAAHVGDVRAEHAGLSQEKAIAQARARAGLPPETHTRRLETLRERLTATADALQPRNLLETLATSLAAPEPFLHLDPIELSVDRTGVITHGDPKSDTLHFVELTSRDQRRWVVILALINREDAHRAFERYETARHYLVI